MENSMIPESAWLDDYTATENRYLIDGLLSPFLTALSGQPKTGKSTLATQMAKAVINQEPILNKQVSVEKTRVCWMGYDAGWANELKTRLSDKEHKSILIQHPVMSLQIEDWEELGQRLVKNEIAYITIDHLYGLGGHLKLNENQEAKKVIRCFEVLINNFNIPVLLIAQATKSQQSGNGMAHSNLLKGAARLLLEMSGSGQKKTLKTIGNEIPLETIKFNQTPTELNFLEVGSKEPRQERDFKKNLERAKRAMAIAKPTELANPSTLGPVLLRLGESKTPSGAQKMAYRLVEKSILEQTEAGLVPGKNYFE
jgi:hypothetical protein